MPRILEVMAEDLSGDLFAQDPLEQLLDEESDEEFGLPEFREHLADSLTPAVLKDWSAADFASIYVRFRPHLERHAKRFLVNPSQVEEVVQDAFLYLMTTLPELDSELGVLKFLKWKTRLLALDVIRANSKASVTSIDDQPELEAKLDDFSRDLERADDAAIVALAMAKLQPRHREVLIATLYEEKTIEVVAAQMGLKENAFRQLLFRARSAFKKALIGEAETAGKTVSEILSIAARKAAKESGKYISAAGAFLLVLAVSIGVIPNISQAPSEQIATPVSSGTNLESSSGQQQNPQPESSASEQFDSAPANNDEPVIVEPANAEVIQDLNTADPEDAELIALVNESPAIAQASLPAQPDTSDDDSLLLAGFLSETLNAAAVDLLEQTGASNVVGMKQGSARIGNGSGISADIEFDFNSVEVLEYVWLTFDVDGLSFAAVPQSWMTETKSTTGGITTVSYVGTDLLIGDLTGAFNYLATDNSELSTGAVRVEFEVDSNNNLLSSAISYSPRASAS